MEVGSLGLVEGLEGEASHVMEVKPSSRGSGDLDMVTEGLAV